jgi:HAD superfamily hydrolase (TIGR01549 family)
VIRALLFDCFGVLTTDTWRAFVDTLPPEVDIDAARNLNRAYGAGIIGRQEFMDGVLDITGRQPREVETLLSSEIAKNTALLAYIQELKPKFKIAMISNIATNWVRDVFLTPQEQELFEEMIFSYEVGMTKPDPRIFMLACERLRVAPREAIMIDDIESYVQAAKAEGLQGIVYQDLAQLKTDLAELLANSND